MKLLEQYKQENQRLKDENGALIRVISKLSKDSRRAERQPGGSRGAPEPRPGEAGLRPWPGALAPQRHRLPPGSSVSGGGAHHTVSDASVDKCGGVVIADAPYDRVRTGLRTRGASPNMTPLALPADALRFESQLQRRSSVTPRYFTVCDHWTASPATRRGCNGPGLRRVNRITDVFVPLTARDLEPRDHSLPITSDSYSSLCLDLWIHETYFSVRQACRLQEDLEFKSQLGFDNIYIISDIWRSHDLMYEEYGTGLSTGVGRTATAGLTGNITITLFERLDYLRRGRSRFESWSGVKGPTYDKFWSDRAQYRVVCSRRIQPSDEIVSSVALSGDSACQLHYKHGCGALQPPTSQPMRPAKQRVL
uniref:(California timema) hypothetical protein n=1 Tax=Timema californicum TaxID=61474 RepID=A0A7R9J2S6_TIMCA|nr:unnamed protein product [Timema californicum]